MTKYFTWETDNFIFDSRNLPVFINKIERPLMAPIETPMRTIGTRAGAYLEDNQLGTLEITIELTLMSDTDALLRKQIRDLAQNLFFEREGKLTFSDELDRYYNAQITGNFDLDSFAAMGETSISFVCGDPFAYTTYELMRPKGSATIDVLVFNDGTYKTFPVVRIVPIVPLTSIRYDNATTGGHVLLTGAFEAWRPIIVDHEHNLVYLEDTGERIMTTVDLSTDFFALAPKTDTLFTFVPTESVSVRITYRERYL